jgi:hypothetical protein
MKQGFTGPVSGNPSSTPRTALVVKLTGKQDNPFIMNDLHGSGLEFAPRISVYGTFNGILLVITILTPACGFDSPGNAFGGITSVLTDDCRDPGSPSLDPRGWSI